MSDDGLKAALTEALTHADKGEDTGWAYVLETDQVAPVLAAVLPVVEAELARQRQQGRNEAGVAIRTAPIAFPARLTPEARQDIAFALGQAARVAESGGRIRAAVGALIAPETTTRSVRVPKPADLDPVPVSEGARAVYRNLDGPTLDEEEA